jgi:acyl-CoA synthetase (NDP forming)
MQRHPGKYRRCLFYKGVSFLTPERAVKALARMNAYREWREK